jgi:hypothetical protein
MKDQLISLLNKIRLYEEANQRPISKDKRSSEEIVEEHMREEDQAAARAEIEKFNRGQK